MKSQKISRTASRSGGCRRLQGEAAARTLHDLSRNAQSDAAAPLFGGEEGDEDVGCHVGADGGTAVAHLYHHRFGGVAVGFDTDAPFRLSGALDGLYGIFQQICHYLRDEVLVGMNQQVVGADVDAEPDGDVGILVGGKFDHTLHERFYVEEAGHGGGDAGEAAVAVDKLQQALAGGADGAQPFGQLVGRVGCVGGTGAAGCR